MSMISEQIKHLKSLQEAMRLDNKLGRVKCDSGFVENRIKIIDDAIDTIETLSAKIQANNFNNGWIKCEDRLPEENQQVLTCDMFGNIHIFTYFIGRNNVPFGIDENHSRFYPVIAWQSLPESYKECD